MCQCGRRRPRCSRGAAHLNEGFITSGIPGKSLLRAQKGEHVHTTTLNRLLKRDLAQIDGADATIDLHCFRNFRQEAAALNPTHDVASVDRGAGYADKPAGESDDAPKSRTTFFWTTSSRPDFLIITHQILTRKETSIRLLVLGHALGIAALPCSHTVTHFCLPPRDHA